MLAPLLARPPRGAQLRDLAPTRPVEKSGLGAAVRWWSAREVGQQLRRERNQKGLVRQGAHRLDGNRTPPDEGKHAEGDFGESAAEAVLLIVHGSGVMMVVRVRTGLIGWMGEDQPTGLICRTGVDRAPSALEKRVNERECNQRQIQRE